MRNLLIIALLAISFASCKKKYCWVCKVEVTQSGSGVPYGRSTQTTTICDKTQEEAAEYEEFGTSRTTSGKVVIVSKTTCNHN